MSSAPSPHSQALLKAILEPLLADFQDWFGRARSRLASGELDLLSSDQQADFLARITRAQQEVSAAQALFRATGEQVGVEMAQMAAWHRLVAEYWQISQRWYWERSESQHSEETG